MTNMPMVDAHVHFWDPTKNYYPWLNDRPLIPFRYGDSSAICRPYLPDDYKRDATPQHNFVKTVYIEAEWDPKDPVGEMEYIAGLRREGEREPVEEGIDEEGEDEDDRGQHQQRDAVDAALGEDEAQRQAIGRRAPRCLAECDGHAGAPA